MHGSANELVTRFMKNDKRASLTAADYSHKAHGRGRAAFFGIIWSTFNAIVPTLSGLLVFVLAARVISAAEIGAIAFGVAIVGLASALGPSGLGDALVQRGELSDNEINVAFWISLIFGCVLALFLVMLAPIFSVLLGDDGLNRILPFLAVRIILDLGAVVPTALLSRVMRFRMLALRTLWSSIASLVVGLSLLGYGFGFWALIFSQIISSLVGFTVSWYSIDWRPRLQFSRRVSEGFFELSFFSSASRFVASVNFDQLLIGYFMGPHALGIYSFVGRIFGQLNSVLGSSLGSVAYPVMSSLQVDREKLCDAFLLSIFLSTCISFPVFLILGIYAGDILDVFFGAKWVEATNAVRAFCVIGFLTCIGVIQAALIRAMNYARWWMWYQIVQQCATVLVVVLVWPFGISIVAAGIAAKTWVGWPVSALKVISITGVTWRQYVSSIGVPFLGALAMLGPIFMVRACFTETIWSLVVGSLSGIAVYIAIILIWSRARLMRLVKMVRHR